MVEQLETLPEKHLILVTYGEEHSPHHEWVYNRANIDAAKVVFARSMADNSALLDYFKDRKMWNLSLEGTKHFLSPMIVSPTD
jgi:hypothetical protein